MTLANVNLVANSYHSIEQIASSLTPWLQKKYPVWINETVLDTLTLDESQKASNVSFFLRKSFTGEAYAPTADPQWISH